MGCHPRLWAPPARLWTILSLAPHLRPGLPWEALPGAQGSRQLSPQVHANLSTTIRMVPGEENCTVIALIYDNNCYKFGWLFILPSFVSSWLTFSGIPTTTAHAYKASCNRADGTDWPTMYFESAPCKVNEIRRFVFIRSHINTDGINHTGRQASSSGAVRVRRFAQGHLNSKEPEIELVTLYRQFK